MTDFPWGRYLDYRKNVYRSNLNRVDYHDNLAQGWTFSARYQGNGIIQPTRGLTDLQMIADDLGTGTSWSSRVGSYVAANTGSPTVNQASPFYPSGGFTGAGSRDAVTGCALDKYYAFPYAANHQINAATDITYECVIRTGDLTTNESILSCYIPGSAAYNFHFQVEVGAFQVLSARVECSVVDAYVSSAITPFTYYFVTITWTAATRTLAMYFNGQNVSSSAGTGDVISDGVSQLYIGATNNGAIVLPMINTHLIEITRHRENLITAGVVDKRVWGWAGVQADTGQYPQGFFRGSLSEVEVNSNLWTMSDNFPVMNARGYLNERAYSNYVSNSTFTEAALTSWTATAVGGTTVAKNTTDAQRFSGVGAGCCEIVTSAGGNNGYITQLLSSAAAATPAALSIDWRGATATPVLYVRIQDQTTLNYYNASTQLWQAGSVWNPCGSGSTTRQRFTLLFVNEAPIAGPLVVDIGNAGLIGNASTTMFIYHVQLSYDVVYAKERIVARTITQVRNTDALIYDSSQCIDYATGGFRLTYTPLYSSAQVPAAITRGLLSGQTSLFIHPSGSGAFRLKDPGLNAVTAADAHSAYEELTYSGKWKTNEYLRLSSPISGVQQTAMGAAIDANNIAVGNDVFQTSPTDGYFKNVRMR